MIHRAISRLWTPPKSNRVDGIEPIERIISSRRDFFRQAALAPALPFLSRAAMPALGGAALLELFRAHPALAANNLIEAFGSATAFTIANANLATSATAGWQSNAIDNSSNLYDDALVLVDFAAVNTIPASSKAIFLFAFGLLDSAGAIYTSTGDGAPGGSEGTLTYPDVTSLPVVAPVLGVVPYPVQNKILRAGPFSVARCFGGVLPVKWAIGMINHSGMTLSVTSIKYLEVKYNLNG